MSGGDIEYDFDNLRSGAGALRQFGQQLQQMGTQFKQVHQQLKEHCSGDESGLGGAIDDAASDAAEAGGNVFTQAGRVLTGMGDRTENNAGRAEHVDSTIASTLDGVGGDSGSRTTARPTEAGGGSPSAESPHGTVTDGYGGPGAESDPLSGEDGQSSTTDAKDLAAAKDPIDPVSGMMFLPETDLNLPGRLPLALMRTFRSNYRKGGLFGPRWASTLDERVEVTADGIHFAAQDGVVLHYPIPEESDGSVLPSAGARRLLGWDRATDVITITDVRTGVVRAFPADSGGGGGGGTGGGTGVGAAGGAVRRLSAITDRSGHAISFLRDEFGLPVEVVHSGGYRVAIDTTDTRMGARVSGLRLLDGANEGAGSTVVVLGYDPRGNLVEVVNSSGIALVFEYDREDRITRWIDRTGSEYCYVYDQAGRVVETSGSGGALSGTMRYDTQARITYSTDSLGHTTEYHYDLNDRVVKEVDPLRNATASTWNIHGDLLSRTDPLGHTTAFEYDAAGNLSGVTRADGTVLAARYNELNLPSTVTGADGAAWTYRYDPNGDLVLLTDPLGATTGYTYSEDRRQVAVTDAGGGITTLRLDGAGLPVETIDPLGARTRMVRDAFGRVVEVTDPLGAVSRFGWNTEGRISWKQGPDGARTECGYDGEGNRTSLVEAGGSRAVTEFGPFGKPSARIDADGTRYTYRYDTELQLIAVENQRGDRWSYEYDAAGRLTAETDFNGRTVSYTADGAGQLASRTNGSGQTVRYQRDALGRVIEQAVEDGSIRYEFDPAGKLARAANSTCDIAYSRDRLGRVLAEARGGHVLQNRYDGLGRRIQRITPTGIVTDWRHDEAGNPVALTGSLGALAFGHDAAGRETTRAFGGEAGVDSGAVLAQSYDSAGRLSRQALRPGGPTGSPPNGPGVPGEDGAPAFELRSYIYDTNGRPSRITDHLTGTRDITLDHDGRVTAVDAVGWSERYVYDAAGNLTQASHSAADRDTAGPREVAGTQVSRAGRTHYERDAQGRIVRTTRRTLSGRRRSWCYSWNALDQLTTATLPDGTVWAYDYDGLGRRCAKRRLNAAGETVERYDYFWDATRLAEQIHTRTSGQRATTWDYRPGSYEPLAQSERERRELEPGRYSVAQQFFAIVSDPLGTPTELVDADGAIAWNAGRRDLWGAPLRTAPDDGPHCPLAFPGQYRDEETGWHYNYYRYYDPETGCYAAPDPLGLIAGRHDFRYTINPLVWTDPLGLVPGQGYCPKTGELDDDTYEAIERQYGPDIAAGVDYNFKKAIGGGETSHLLPGIGNDPEALAQYLSTHQKMGMTHTDNNKGNTVAYDQGNQVIVVNAPGNFHAFAKPQSEWDSGVKKNRYTVI